MLTLFFDEALANEAAIAIGRNKNTEVNQHSKSQFFVGLIAGATVFTPTGALLAEGLYVYDYVKEQNAEGKEQREATEKVYESYYRGDQAENEKEKTLGQSELGNITSTDRVRDLDAAIIGDVASETAKAAEKEGFKKGIATATAEYVGESSFKGFYGSGLKGSLKGFGIGFVGGLVNTWINHNSNHNENDSFQDALFQSISANNSDRKNGINVIANEV